MPEQQNIEYKQSWHDDYLKWVCGFANAQGGSIFIGKDDKQASLNAKALVKLAIGYLKVGNKYGIKL